MSDLYRGHVMDATRPGETLVIDKRPLDLSAPDDRRELLEALGGYWYCEVSAARPCKPDDNLGDPEMHFWCHWAVPAGADDE